MKHFLFALSLFPLMGFGQEVASPEVFLSETGREILANSEYNKRKAACDTFVKVLKNYIGTDEGYDDKLSTVKSMLRLEHEDDFRIYTWQMPDSSFKYVKYGLIAAKTKKGIVVTQLVDNSSMQMEPEFKTLKANSWYGAIYYQIIPVKKGRDEVYTLLGFAPDETINRKVIDVLTIDNKGKPVFGEKIFHFDEFMDKTYRRAPMRIILSYGGKYAASVRWNEDKEMIVMDHLSPPDPKLKGVYSTYGPDMSYDAMIWKKGWWELQREVKFDSKQNIRIIPPSKPTDLPPGKGNRSREESGSN